MRSTDLTNGERNVVGERSKIEVARIRKSISAKSYAPGINSLSSEQIRRESGSSSFLVLDVLLPSLMLDHVENIGNVGNIATGFRQFLVDRLGEELDVSLRVLLDVGDEVLSTVSLQIITSSILTFRIEKRAVPLQYPPDR